MKYEFKEDQTEEYYRKLLLLDKVKPLLSITDKQIIFNKGYCWDILLKDEDAPLLCYSYSKFHNKRFPEGEKYILRDYEYTLEYYKNIFLIKNKSWKEGEKKLNQENKYFNPNLKNYKKLCLFHKMIKILIMLFWLLCVTSMIASVIIDNAFFIVIGLFLGMIICFMIEYEHFTKRRVESRFLGL